MAVKEVSAVEGETVLVAVVAKEVVLGSWSDVGWVSGLFQTDLVIQGLGSSRRMVSVHPLLVSRVGFLRICVCMVIRSA